MGERRHPVVAMGLAGASLLALPDTAQALSIELVDATFSTPTDALLVGAVGGMALTGAIAVTSALVVRSRSRAGDEVPVIARHMRADAAPTAGERPEPSRAHGPSHAATNYEDIAENYVGRATFRERMARRAEGVAATLRDRLGANMMDGVPVIARADGSVGDVGTSWWKNAVGEQSIISDSGFAADEPAIAIPSDFSRPDAALLDARPARSTGISLRVANIDEGAYPERRTVDDLNVTDDWDLALRSLDERIAVEAAALAPMPFADMVGGADTLDEPDNLEPQTAFIPFKTPAGHPEVVDTETYVDYLIEDEFSKSSSPVARRSSSRFLRVLEGGTQPSRSLSDTGAVTREQGGKHFAAPMAAQA